MIVLHSLLWRQTHPSLPVGSSLTTRPSPRLDFAFPCGSDFRLQTAVRNVSEGAAASRQGREAAGSENYLFGATCSPPLLLSCSLHHPPPSPLPPRRLLTLTVFLQSTHCKLTTSLLCWVGWGLSGWEGVVVLVIRSPETGNYFLSLGLPSPPAFLLLPRPPTPPLLNLSMQCIEKTW